jgi:Protein of unknown function DUF45
MQIRVTRSDRRAKTVSARLVDGVLEVRAPVHLSDAELQPIIASLQERVAKRHQPPALDDGELDAIARRLNQQYFQGALQWESIRWSQQQERRFGSCTPATRSIRISHRLAKMPQFVRDYVVMHELAHLVEANHGPRFWRLVNRYPRTERARGYLMAVGLEGLDEPPADVD